MIHLKELTMKFAIKNKKMAGISLLLMLHGLGILENNVELSSNPQSFRNLFSIDNDIYLVLGFIFGSILLVDAIGLLFSSRTKIFYVLTKMISIIFMIYVIFGIIYVLKVYGLKAELPVLAMLFIFIVLYGFVFKYIDLDSGE
jgi:hypothetical protein